MTAEERKEKYKYSTYPALEAGNNFQIGDKVPYINTASKLSWCIIEDFREIKDKKRVWFNGVDVKTNAGVWYPEHLAYNYFTFINEYAKLSANDAWDACKKYEELCIQYPGDAHLFRDKTPDKETYLNNKYPLI